MAQDQGASASADRATRASPEPASGLGQSASVPCAWRPIETAPRDGSEILIFEQTASGPMFRVGYWETSGEHIDSGKFVAGWSEADDGYIGCIEPTHWMPLPDAPVPA